MTIGGVLFTMRPDGRDHQEHDHRAEDQPSDARQTPPDGGEQDRQNGQNQQRLEEHGAD
jgi:hypothetical protein